MTPQDLVQIIHHLLDEKKAENIVTIPMPTGGLFDYMVIATGSSSRQLSAMADHVCIDLKKRGILPVQEGAPNSEWLLIDAGDVIVHMFKPDARQFYNLEKMWLEHPSATTNKVLV
jgi:ribosome-associated protein